MKSALVIRPLQDRYWIATGFVSSYASPTCRKVQLEAVNTDLVIRIRLFFPGHCLFVSLVNYVKLLHSVRQNTDKKIDTEQSMMMMTTTTTEQ